MAVFDAPRHYSLSSFARAIAATKSRTAAAGPLSAAQTACETARKSAPAATRGPQFPGVIPPMATQGKGAGAALVVRVRVHDGKSPCAPHDWQTVAMQWEQNGSQRIAPLTWYGEYLWRANLADLQKGPIEFFVIAVDAAGNESRSVVVHSEVQ